MPAELCYPQTTYNTRRPEIPKTAQHANLHFITDHLAIGGDVSTYDALLSARQLYEIEQLGITHIVDCRIEWDDTALFAEHVPSIGYLHHGMDDAGQEVPAEWFHKALDWIDAAGPEAVVLTHCHMGINRGPSLGYAVLLHQGWDPIDAMIAIRRARPIANIWYADDALKAHHLRHNIEPYDDLARLRAWRAANPLDVVRAIRTAREAEAG